MENTDKAVVRIRRRRGDPVLQRERAVIARDHTAGFQRKRDERQNGAEQADENDDDPHDILACRQVDVGDLPGLSGNRRERFALAGHILVDQQDRDAEYDHDDRHDISLTVIAAVDEALHVSGEHFHGPADVLRHGIGAHRAGEHEQEGGHQRGQHDGESDAVDDLGAGGLEHGRRLFEVGVHVAQDAADEDIGEGRIMQPEHDRAGHQPVDEPFRHTEPRNVIQHPAPARTDVRVLPEILPEGRKRPARHNVREHEDGRDDLLALHVGAGDEKGDDPAVYDGDNARQNRHENGIEQRLPEVYRTHIRRKETLPPKPRRLPHHDAVCGFLNGTDGKGTDNEGEQRIKDHERQNEQKDHEDHVRRVEKKSLDRVEHLFESTDLAPCRFGFFRIICIHSSSLQVNSENRGEDEPLPDPLSLQIHHPRILLM